MKYVLLLLALALPTSVLAMPVTFDLRDATIESIDEVAAFSLTQGGITASLQANVGVLNRTGSGFGINIVGDGCDNSDALDQACAGVAPESISVSFDQAVQLISTQISGLSGNDAAQFSLLGATFDLTASGLYSPMAFLAIGQTFSWTSLSDNNTATGQGFSFDNFTVQAVPEPASFGLLGLGLLGLGALRRTRG